MPTSEIANFRDVGGLPLVGGGRTRTGVLLRSAAPLNGDVLPHALRGHPFTVIDLRSDTESKYDPFTWPIEAKVLHHNIFDPGDLNRLRGADLAQLYRDMVEAASDRILAITPLISTEGPTLIHCAAGKDRTGVVVAVLLLLSGVEPAAVVADYRRTEQAMPAVIARLSDSGAVDPSNVTPLWYSAPAEAISLVVRTLVDHPGGGPIAWYDDHGGHLDALRQLRARLREAS
jgi:protein-tyrosine phosphatase